MQIIEKCQPFRVQMSCGHVEIRMMRESTAGEPFSPQALLTSSVGCAECEPSKAEMREMQREINAKYAKEK